MTPSTVPTEAPGSRIRIGAIDVDSLTFDAAVDAMLRLAEGGEGGRVGMIARSPRWMSATGFEWLFRLTREPRRLGRRFLVGSCPPDPPERG